MANIDPDIDLTESRIEGYVSLDLSVSGEIAQNLNERIERELGAQQLILTDCLGEQPAHITPQMNSWYSAHIAPMRGLALSALKGKFEQDKKSFLLEARLGSIHENLVKFKRDALQASKEQKKSDHDERDKLREKLKEAESDYEAKRAEYGRDPVHMRKLPYFGLLALLAIPEFLINFESFANLSWATPFIASGITIIVAVAIAASGHIHGSIIRQWDYFFGAHCKLEDKGKGWRVLAVGQVLLIFVLGLVYYARDSYIIQTFIDLGDGVGPNKLWLIGGSVFGNIIVFLIGVVFAWYTHDEDPEFPKNMLKYKEAKIHYDRLNDKLEKHFNQEIGRLVKEAEKLEKAAKLADAPQKRAVDYMSNRKLYDQISAQDKRVIALFDDYRARLMDAFRDRNTDIIMVADDARKERSEVSIDTYLAQGLKLKTL